MIAVDTSIVVRFLVRDDPAQFAKAKQLFAAETVLIPKTVLLETAWVLQRLYDHSRDEAVGALASLVSLPCVHCEDEHAVTQALAWARAGMDIADAFHLVSSHAADRFMTYDQAMIRRARSLSAVPPASSP